MRRTYALITSLLLLCSCSKDNGSGGESTTTTDVSYGTVLFGSSVSSSVETRNGVDLGEVGVTLPTTADFSLKIYGSYDPEVIEDETASGTINSSYGSIDEHNSSPLWLYENEEGYTAEIVAGDPAAEGENSPYFEGSATFYVAARTQTSAAIPASLKNSLFTFETSDWFDSYYDQATLTITTSAGNSFTFSKGSDPRYIFVAAGTTLYLSGSAVKTNDASVTFTSNSIGTTTQGKLSSIVVDASHIGGESISVSFDSTLTEVDEISAELNPNAAPSKF